MLSPFYSLCADLEDGTGRELLVCRKVLRSRSPHYVFSLKSEDLWRKREQRSRLYLGKLRATSASEYVLYDSGEMDVPKLGGSSTSHLEQEDDEDAEGEPGEGGRGPVGHRRQGDEMRTSLTSAKGSISSALNDVETSLYRQQMAVIVFNTKARPVADDTRGMEVCVPVPGPAPRPGDAGEGKGLSFVASAPSKSSDIQTPFQRIRGEGRQNELWHQKYFVLHERQSKYDPLSSCLVDFKGRACMASIKNFQLVESSPLRVRAQRGVAGGNSYFQRSVEPTEEQEREVVFLQLGKATEQCFNLDYRYPLTMVQAFAIAIS
eukprot:gene3811-4762_t